ncbi:uncharacterized protein LOC124312339 isoform X2 [Daphnia pulicaria]|uniref:uncharacterized protein LOC124312339 isoform X2 n=1 Tax=Daphnia pulicaria TaxID=35523 RepID=UPI001EEBE25A|nr:uncharacterized protein LOC124312339 isoform X2 [Daphnia pulicaria]
MKLPISLFIFQNAVFLLFFNDSFCAPSQTSGKRIKHQISVETGVENSYTRNGDSILTNEENLYDMEQLIRDLELRDKQSNDLVQEFKNLGDYFTNSEDSTKPNQTILFEVKAVWQRIIDSNLSEFADYFTNLELRKEMARILFIAGERFCESPDETFFNGQCLPIGSSEHCPSENMSLVDGPDNNGFCDCLDTKGENNLQIIFSDQTGRCYSQNTRGPCNVGEWFVLNDIPRCESIPNECPDDGRHVYGKIRVYRDSDPSVEAGCWEIGRTCPDEVSVVQVQQDDYGNLDVFCSYDWKLRLKQLEDLVQVFKHLTVHFTNSVESNQLVNQTFLTQVKDVWQRLGGSSVLTDALHRHLDDVTQFDLKKNMARILFTARERLCESPDETFFNGQCLRVYSDELCGNMGHAQLVDGPDNRGFCDCHGTGDNNLKQIFSHQTSQCYSQYTRGPCNVGEWFVLKDIPRCESIPNGCPDDGRHVYGNIKANFTSDPSTEAGCWEIGQKCPDEMSVVEVKQHKDRNFDVFCSSFYNGFIASSIVPNSLVVHKPCRKGLLSSRDGNCVRGFFG